MKEFPTAKMDSQTLLMTVIICLLAFALPVYLNYRIDDDSKLASLIPGGIIGGAILISYLLKPKLYLDHKNIRIKNYFSDIEIPVSDLEGVKRYEKVGFNLRTFGVGGVFGYFGYFNGNDVWYVTNIHKKIKIKSPKTLYIISPENPEEFLDEINRMRSNYLQNKNFNY